MDTASVTNPSVELPGSRRIWRVGSLSMGVTLILMGAALAVSLWQNIKAFEMLMWIAPVVFIMLGAELLLYLKFSGSEKTVVRYDWMSVFFVGMVGLASVAFTLLLSTGLFDEVQRALNMTNRSVFVETTNIKVPDDVKKIVVHHLNGVTIDKVNTRELKVIGQIRYRSSEKYDRLDDKILQTDIVGSTMYVTVASVDHRDGGFLSDTVEPELTLVVPEGIPIVEQ